MAAMSQAHMSSPPTRPYIRVEAVYSFAVLVRATTSVVRSMRGPLTVPA